MGEIPDFDATVNPFADLTDDCKRVLNDLHSSNRRKRAEAALALLTDEERLDLFTDYCRNCGKADPSCPCWNDE